jgi:hypothetical protein
LLREVSEIAAIPTPEEMAERLAKLPPVSLSVSHADAVRAERDSR